MLGERSYKFRVFLNGEYMGDCSRPNIWRGSWVRPRNLHFFCPTCGRDWAQFLAVDEDLPHYAAHTTCRNCGGLGSLAHPYDEIEFPDLPRAVLEYEVALAAEDLPRYWRGLF